MVIMTSTLVQKNKANCARVVSALDRNRFEVA
jgi:hypothetical protein